MTNDPEPPPESKLTRSKERWAREGKFLTGKIAAGGRAPATGAAPDKDWPILDLGLTPNMSPSAGDLMSIGAVEHPQTWSF